jgi:hypothetical protein
MPAQYIQRLPAVFQTVTEKKFFDATFDQVFQKKDSDLLSGFLGRRNPGSYNPITDFYLPEPSKNRTWWQLEPTAFARDADTNKTNVFFYDDILENIEYYGGNTLNQDRLFASQYYSFGPPIDYDMFINYQNYYWIEQGLPVIEITGVMSADIIGQTSYTTPPTANPPNLKLTSGMTISLVDDPLYTEPHILENFGGCPIPGSGAGTGVGLDLIKKTTDITAGTLFEFLPWDGVTQLPTGRVIDNRFWDMTTWEIEPAPGEGDYITIERGALDNNAWSRTNKWYHISAINATNLATSTPFPSNATRALRPIIQFVANIPLYKSGTQFKSLINFGFKNNANGIPLTLSQFQGQTTEQINDDYGIDIKNNDLVIWFNDSTSNQNIWIAAVNETTRVITFTINTSVVDGDTIIVEDDAPFGGAQSGQTYYYANNIWQEAYNDKASTNQPPLFELLDHNGIKLDDSVVYPHSSFRGSKIFSYKINTSPGATVDPVLKFPIVYDSLGQSTDIIFQNNLITDRYVYGDHLIPIDGYYYYDITTGEVLFNNWNLYDGCPCVEASDLELNNFNRFTAFAGQIVFNTSMPLVHSDNQLQVFLNGVYQLLDQNYELTGTNQITFLSPLSAFDDVIIYIFSDPNIPLYQNFVAADNQRVFDVSFPTVGILANKSYLQVYVNGVYQLEGLTKSYIVTGPTQITFFNDLPPNADVTIYGFTTVEQVPNYSSQAVRAGQTDVSIPFTVTPATPTSSYIIVYLNGVYQSEGLSKNYRITGSNQITFNIPIPANSDIVVYGSSQPLADFCLNVSKQRVIDKFAVGYPAIFQFRLSVTPYGYVFGAGALQPDADIDVNVNGTSIKNDPNGFTFFERNNRIYIDLTHYLTGILVNSPAVAPVVEAQTYTHGLLDPDYPGYFQIPQQLEANPTQLEVGEISASNLAQHFSSIIENQDGFEGYPFGGINNYRDTHKNRSLGLYILQNVSPMLKSMLIASSDDLDFFKGVRFSADEYTKFKNRFLSTAQNLINQGFVAFQVHSKTVNISLWVGEILKILNISKEFSNAFAYSYMVAQGTPLYSESFSVSGDWTISVSHNNYIDLNDPRNILYLYDRTDPKNEHILTVGVDYRIVSTDDPIKIELILGPNVKDILVTLYQNPIPTYIPSTPTKVGAWGAYIPRIELDTSYIAQPDIQNIPGLGPTVMSPYPHVIIGHDGSKTIAYSKWDANGVKVVSDYRDNLLLDIETRIYNGLQTKYRDEYYIPLRLESVKPGYFRKTRYSRDEYLEITESYLNKWTAKNRANYRVNDWPLAYSTTTNDQKWKLYNYRLAISDFPGKTLDLPGNWKGIFQYYYDTYYPDTRPWEMLGFSQEPDWWRYEYGAPLLNAENQEVWGSNASGNNVLYKDIEAGIIRQGPSAIYDPNTSTAQPQEMWARIGLDSQDLIPVDPAGNVRNVIELFNVEWTGNYDEPFDHFDDPWIYGDGAPVEQAWMSTSGYAFCGMEFLYLMKPGQFGELLWDTLGTELSTGMITVPTSIAKVRSSKNWQYVQNDIFSYESDPFFKWMRPKNKDQIVHAEIVDGITQIRFGYQNWISDRILFLGKDIAETFGHKVRTLDVNLANKVAGYINKDTTNTYISSVTPGANTNTLIIPSTNFDVLLHKSPVVDTYSYSGIIIRAIADGTFVVYGYDLLNSEFITLNRKPDKLIDITVGGTPAEFRYFETGGTYKAGEIVRYNGIYYESKGAQTVQKFDPISWNKLKTLPTVGGVSVTYKPVSDVTITKYPYGSVITTVQEVFDLMIGWGAYLESKGWQFQDVNHDTNVIADWLSSAKQFLFWITTSWAPDSSIQLSPLANSATLIVQRGYPNDVETLSNGVYSILDKYGIAIPPNSTTTDRNGPLITVAPADLATGGIYYLQVNSAETEHVLIFDNITNFGDVIYDPLLRARQQRLRFNGFRSNGWYGKMEAPGYLIIDDQLVPNYDTIVEAMRYYYDPNVTIDNPSLEDLGRHLIGFESKSYLDNLEVANDVQYLFYQGVIRQKGTKDAFDKLFRSTKIQSNEIIKVFEEWALKLADFGNTIEQVSTEFKLTPEQNTGEVIVARLNFVPSTIGFVKQVNIVNAETMYINIPKLIFSEPEATPPIWIEFNPAATYGIGDIVRLKDLKGNPNFYRRKNSVGSGPFNLGDWDNILATRVAKAYVVLDDENRISRIDVTDPGFGYLEAPLVLIDSGSESHGLDKIYAVWQGAILKDPTLNNIIDIDIDDVSKWVVRPPEPSVALEFPMTDNIEYAVPNAGYVHFDDIDYSIFDVNQLLTIWGIGQYNPIDKNTIWVANNFIEDWNVYKMYDVSAASGFDITKNGADQLLLRTRTPFLLTPQLSGGSVNSETDFGNMLSLYVKEAHAVVSSVSAAATATVEVFGGQITNVTVISEGAGYTSPPTITITGDGSGATLIPVIEGDKVASIIVESGGGFYTQATITISAPTVGIGSILSITVTKSGSYYFTVPTIASFITAGSGAVLDTQIIDTVVAEVIAENGGTGYAEGDEIIFAPPMAIDPAKNFALPFRFNEDETINNPGYNIYNLVTLEGIPIVATDIPDYVNFTNLLIFKNMRYLVEPNLPNASWIDIGDKIWVDGVDLNPPKWNVYNIITPTPAYPKGHKPFRTQEKLINTSLFESASVFNDADRELVQLQVYDPFKFILPGPAKQNLTWISLRDPARYNITPDERLFSDIITFGEAQVGKLWWDLSSARYVYYEQPKSLALLGEPGFENQTENLAYRRDHWGQLFPGSVVAVYEWMKSDVPPSLYKGVGTPRDIFSYVQISTSNRFTSITETNYYFWVRGATDKPNVNSRTAPALDVARLLQSPKSQGFAFFSPIQQTATNNSYMFYNVQEILAYQGDNVQIQYRISERDDQEHTQWQLFREGDPSSIITDQFWDKMVDSLCGYTKLLPVTGEWKNGIVIANYLPWDIYGWDVAPWDNATSTTIPEYGEVLPVPDPTLSEREKYGIKYRPRQGMFVKLQMARKIFVQASNELLKHIPIRDKTPGWRDGVSTDEFWTYTNWYELGYEDAVPTVVYQTLTQANLALTTGQLTKDTIIQVLDGTIDGRYILYAVVQINPNVPVLSLNEIAIENSAIKLLDTMYTTINRYDLSVELRQLLNAFRTQVMINEFLVDQNELYFSMVNYVLSEQKNPDWVFKTSYIFIREENIPLVQSQLFIPDQIGNIINYIKDVKPYHVQIRDYASAYTITDIAAGSAIDLLKWNIKVNFGPSEIYPVDPFDYESAVYLNPNLGWDYLSSWDYELVFQNASSSGNVVTVANTYGLYVGMRVENVSGPDLFDPLAYVSNVIDNTTFSIATKNVGQPPIISQFTGTNIRTLLPWDILRIANQSVSRNKVPAMFDPAGNPWPGFEQNTIEARMNPEGPGPQYPHTINFIDWSIDGPQNIVIPSNIIAVKTQTKLLIYGSDYYVVNNGLDYTVYFFQDPGPDPVAFIWFNGGETQNTYYNSSRNELAFGSAPDNIVINVDTKNPNDPTKIISFKQVFNPALTPKAYFYRNAYVYAGTLVSDITYEDVPITVYVEPNATLHIDGTDIFPNPLPNRPGVVWIEGERIEYMSKTLVATDTWTLQLTRRGTKGTTATPHLAMVPMVNETTVGPVGETILIEPEQLTTNYVWVEEGNEIPGGPPNGADGEIWNATNPLPDPTSMLGFDTGPFDSLGWDPDPAHGQYTRILGVAPDGLWGADTQEAVFLKEQEGKAIP